MARKDPLQGEYYLHEGEIYRVVLVSRGTDEVIMCRLSDDTTWQVRFSVFRFAYKRVWKTGAVAQLLNRSPRSIYRYEQLGRIQKAKRYTDAWGRELRFYTKQDILDMHELLSGIHAGRPRKDKRVVNNSLPAKAELLTTFRERFGE